MGYCTEPSENTIGYKKLGYGQFNFLRKPFDLRYRASRHFFNLHSINHCKKSTNQLFKLTLQKKILPAFRRLNTLNDNSLLLALPSTIQLCFTMITCRWTGCITSSFCADCCCLESISFMNQNIKGVKVCWDRSYES